MKNAVNDYVAKLAEKDTAFYLYEASQIYSTNAFAFRSTEADEKNYKQTILYSLNEKT